LPTPAKQRCAVQAEARKHCSQIQEASGRTSESGGCLERDVEMAVAFQAETRETADLCSHTSSTSRDSFRKSTTITNTKPSWPLRPFTSQICEYFGTPRSTHVRHVRVTRLCFALNPREIGPAGVQIDSPQGPCNDWYVDCEHSHSLVAFLTFLSVSRSLSISTTSLCARSHSSSLFLASRERGKKLSQQSWPGRQDHLGASQIV